MHVGEVLGMQAERRVAVAASRQVLPSQSRHRTGTVELAAARGSELLLRQQQPRCPLCSDHEGQALGAGSSGSSGT